jgi:hypothetical protein
MVSIFETSGQKALRDGAETLFRNIFKCRGAILPHGYATHPRSVFRSEREY